MTDTTDDIAEEISFQSLDDDCRLLGSLLNDVLQREVGPQVMEKIEKIRILAQSALNMRTAGIEDTAEVLEKQLKSEISNMTLEDALTLARAFSRYLNLMTIAKTHHRVRKARNVPFLSKSCDDIFNKLIHSGIAPEDLYDTVCKQVVEIVLTAHPTQINRRTLQYKHIRIAYLLEYNARADLSHEDRDMLIEDLVREITTIWRTDELRRHKPTPVDEARAVFHIVEQHIVVQSLWRAVPRYLRRVSNALKKVHTSAPGYLDLTEPHRTLRGLACTCNPSASLVLGWEAIEMEILMSLQSEENLRAALSKMGVGGHSMEDVMEKVRNCHYQRFMEPLVMLGLTIQTNTLLTAKTS